MSTTTPIVTRWESAEVETAAMTAAGFTYDPVRGYERWTRFREPMITALRSPWMLSSDWYKHCQNKIAEANKTVDQG